WVDPPDVFLKFSASAFTQMTFSAISGLTVPENGTTNIMIIMNHSALQSGEGILSYIASNMITGTGEYTGDTINNITVASGTSKIVPGELYISHYSNGDAIIKSLTKSAELNHELICIKLSANLAEALIVTKIGISLDYIAGAADSDFTNARLFIDNGTAGTYESALDISIGATNVAQGKVIFENISGLTVDSNNIKYVLLVIEHKAMTSGEGVRAIALTNQFETIGLITDYTDVAYGSATGVLKKVPASLIITSISNGDVADTLFTSAPESDREILALKISATSGENITLNTLKISLLYGNGATDTQITNARLFIDNGTIGTYETGVDTVLLGTLIKPTNNLLSFTNISGLTIPELSSKYVLLIFDHKNMPISAYLKPVVKSNYVIGTGLYTAETITATTTVTGVIKQVGGEGRVYVSVNSNGDAVNEKYLTKSPESIKELIAFRLSADSFENRKILSIAISLAYNGTAANTDFTNARLYYDTGTIGTYDTETATQLISTVSAPTGTGWIVFDGITGLTITSNWGTNFIVIIGHKTLTPNEGLIAYINDGAVQSVGVDSGITNTSLSNGTGVLKKVPADLYVFNISNGNVVNPSFTTSAEQDKEIICLKLSATAGDRLSITSLAISLNYGNGAVDADFTNARLFIDLGTTGSYDAGTDIFISSVIAQPSSGWLNFGGISGVTLNENGITNFLLVLDHKTMQPDESVQAIVPAGYVQSVGEYTGYPVSNITSATGITKIVGGRIVISIYTQNDLYIKHLTSSPQSNIEILGLHLSAVSAEDLIINQIRISLVYQGTAVDSDFTNLALFADLGTTGTYDASDIQIGNIITEPSTGIVLFDNITGFTVRAYSATNILFVAAHNLLGYGEGLQGIILTNWVRSIGVNSDGTNYSAGSGTGVAKEVPGMIYISCITQGESGDTYLLETQETNKEMMLVKLSASAGERKIITRIKISLDYISGITDTDITNVNLYYDSGTTGTYDTADILLSAGVSAPSSGVVIFSNISGFTLDENSTTNLLLVLTHKTLQKGDKIQPYIKTNWIESSGLDTSYTNTSLGSATGVIKTVPTGLYVSVITQGNTGLKYISASSENNVELLLLKLSASAGEDKVVTRIKLSLYSDNTTITDSDITNCRLYIDLGTAGVYDGADIQIGTTITEPSGMVVIFSNISGFTVKESATTNVLFIIGHNSLNYGDRISGIIQTGWIESFGTSSGYTNNDDGPGGAGVTKEVPGKLVVSTLTQGDTALKYLLATSQTNVELIQLRLSATIGEDKIVNSIRVSLYSESAGIVDTDLTNLQVFIDRGTIGTYDASDIAICGLVSQPSGMIALFTISGLTV
ncbi:MAG: hypothetical protein DRO92_02770, partial [Candidatus Altiarchaeales archaeon]